MIDPDVMDIELPRHSGYQRPAADGTANRSIREIVLSLESIVTDLVSLAQGAPPRSSTPTTPQHLHQQHHRHQPCRDVDSQRPSPASFAESRDRTDIPAAQPAVGTWGAMVALFHAALAALKCRANLPTNPPPVPRLIPGIDEFVDILPIEDEPQDQFSSQDDTVVFIGVNSSL